MRLITKIMKPVFYLLLITIVFCFKTVKVNAQNNRLNIKGNIGWYNFFGTIKTSKKWSLHAEYQWRRYEFVSNWQQSLLRIGVNYMPNPRLTLRLGYGLIETFNYGTIPLNGFGKSFTEHRIFQMAQLAQKEGTIDITHRLMLEQRFIGKYSSASETKESSFPLLNRVRYLLRLQHNFNNKNKSKFPTYLAAYNEIFIGFGKNVNANVFDQNRTALLVGKALNNNIKIELGYLQQILQFGRLVNNQPVFQNNKGFLINLVLNTSTQKK
jgi:hypothetical protein